MSLKYHYNLIYNDLDATLRSFKWDSIQTKMAFKTALSCATAILIANWIKLDNPYWSGITALVIMRPNVGAIFQKGWMRAIGCTIGCQLLCFYFLGYCVQNPILFSIFIFSGICLAFYLGVQAKNGYFWSYMTSNMALIAMIVHANPYNNFPLHIMFYRSAEISLGVLVSWFYSIILWPRYAGDDLSVKTSELVNKSASLLKSILILYKSEEANSEKIRFIYKNEISTLIKQCRALIDNSGSEKKLLNVDDNKFREVLRVLEYRTDQMAYTYKTYEKIGVSKIISNYSGYFQEVINTLEFIIKYKKTNFEKHKNSFLKLHKVSNELNKALSLETDKLKRKNYSIKEVMLLFEISYSIESFANDLLNLCKAHINTDTTAQFRNIERKKFDKDFIIFEFGKFYFPLYLPALKNASKGGLAIIATFWACLWLNIPGGLANMSVAILAVFSPQMDNMATKHKGILRFLGCLTGASLGLLFLAFAIESTLFLMIIIILVTFGLCIIWAGKPGVAYIGLQAGIPFVLCVGSFAPNTTMDSAIERLTGIFLAISMMWLCNYILFPENLCLKLKYKIDNLKEAVLSFVNSENFFSNLEPEVKDFYPVIAQLHARTASMVKVIELQQDLPVEELNNIKNWADTIEKIIKKFMFLNSIDSEVMHFVQLDTPELLAHIRKTIEIVINNNNQINLDNYLAKIEVIIDTHISELRTTEGIAGKSLEFKKEFSKFITIFKHLLNDARNISKIRINYQILQ